MVVELFQSKGCSSCPPTNASLNAIADRGDVLAPSFAVTASPNPAYRSAILVQDGKGGAITAAARL